MTLSQIDIISLIYKAEYYIITKEDKLLSDMEYGLTFVDENAVNKLLCTRLVLKALKYQYTIDSTSDIVSSLYTKLNSLIGLNLQTLPEIDSNLIIYDSSSIGNIVFGTVSIATYEELISNYPENADKVVSVKVFNEYFSNLRPVSIYTNIITIEDGLEITHNLNTEYTQTSFIDSSGIIYCDFTNKDLNTITLHSNVTIPNVRITILG